ncbi:glycosyl hydrolase family 71-domain-containing protein [Diplogelasinospora grovesii]|uniref:Glycosyl hydrolase family 71-domain-containing protein n=1 Tax=Diplogelasinospora grovesii TaxID=303347 RepID=A0AAN6N4Y6_9PEZI|nr:glycosyl hydrolase family 71-domain-containing protein [Diplogelasinospora grovesii]
MFQGKAVFTHFMVGNANNYTQSDWETDIGLAQEAHIDAFALNIANDVGGITQAVQLAFYVASQKGFKLFFSFDYAGNGPWDKDDVITLCTSYCNNPAYYHTNGGPLLTTLMYLEQAGDKPYMMPASPWFYTNLPGYSKNWLWRRDETWYDRWVQIIYNQPDFVEIISRNDYGESHYIGPLYDKAMEAFTVGEGPFNYASGMPHNGWRAFLPYVIDLYKESTATITQEGVQGWWRRAAASFQEPADSDGQASQLQIEFAPSAILADKIFFSALLGSHADVSVTVGGTALNAAWSWTPDDGIGIYHGSADFGSATGDVVIAISRSGRTVAALSPGSAGSIGTQSCGDSISATPTLKISEQKCINGTGYQNFEGICDFAYRYGYCDHSACVCKAMGSPSATPSGVAPTGYPAAGLDASYAGVCAFDCEHGYCPPSACSYEESPLTTPTVSDFSPPACIAGSAIAGPNSALGGLCSYACNFGFCPYLVCHCDGQGALHETPAKIDGYSGKAADGVEDHGLCSFACERGYCPAPTCVNTTSTGSGSGGDSGSTGPGGIFFKDPGCVLFPDDCPAGQYRIVVCPLGATPGRCEWRGTGPLCDPTCQPGEVAIETSKHGSSSCLAGEQGLCCKSDTSASLVSSCSWTSDYTYGVG